MSFKPVVVRNIPRADASDIATLRSLGVSTVHEAMGRVGLLHTYMRPVWPGPWLRGVPSRSSRSQVTTGCCTSRSSSAKPATCWWLQ